MIVDGSSSRTKMGRKRGLDRLPALVLLILCAAVGGRALALDPQRAITELRHSTWTAREGAPSNISALAQGHDGFLWIGASSGLYRFDGVTFEQIPPIPNDHSRSDGVTALAVTRDGVVWVGFGWGGLAVIENGRLRPVPFDRLKERINRIAEAPDGTLWVETNRADGPLMHYRNGRWTVFGLSAGVPAHSLQSMLVDDKGAVWITGYQALSVLRPGATTFTEVEPISGQTALTEDRAGRVWIFDAAGVRRLADYAKGAAPNLALKLPNPDSSKKSFALIDRDGGFWGDDGLSGLIRLPPDRPDWVKDLSPLPTARPAANRGASSDPPEGPAWIKPLVRPAVERLTASQGLASNAAGPLFEDREGNVWLGGPDGLERFSAPGLSVARGVPVSAAFAYQLHGDRSGTVLISGESRSFRVDPGQPVARQWFAGELETSCAGRPDGFWLMTPKDALHLVGGRTEHLPFPKEAGAVVQACAVDALGALWMPGRQHGVFRLYNGVWSQLKPPGLDTRRHWITRADADPQGRMLIYARFGAPLFRVTGLSSAPVAGGAVPDIGLVSAIVPIGNDVLLTGQFGIARLRDERYTVLSSDRYPWLRKTLGLAKSSSDDTWILTQSGIYRVSMRDLQAAFDAPGRPIAYRLFDETDGIPGPIGDTMENPVVVGGDGRVWFGISHGVVVLDPRRLVQDTAPPPVVIRAITVDGRRTSDPRDLRLPTGAANLQIDFTAPSLTAPERIAFRYKLEGVDRGWVDPGSRRQAFYTNLPPGHYRFHVIAANKDGVWNTQGATLSLDLPPTFLQSWTFKLLCGAAAALALWFLYALRMRQVAERVSARLEARRSERERIARELHDTLLQGLQGLILRFHSIARRIPDTEPARPLMEQALNEADGILIESRDHVRELRSHEAVANFTQVFGDAAAKANLEPRTRLEVVTHGPARELHPIVRDEITRIAEQAIQNVAQHAGADNLEISVAYERSRLLLTIIDDGVGIAPEILRRGGREGHFGLVGLRERAHRIHGALTLTSAPGEGVRLTLSVPAGVAYAAAAERAPRGFRWPKWREALT
jgi:signal transduction histidine kinase